MPVDCSNTEAAVVYHLRPHRAATRLLEVHCQVREPDPAGQVFSLPAWTPGSYMIRDFARHVVAIDAMAGAQGVPLHKIGKSTWRAAPTVSPLVVRMEVYASDLSVRGACLDPDGAFFNGSSVFLRVHGREQERCILHISPGEDPGMAGWQVAGSFDRVSGADGDFGAFAAADYEELIDHPVLMGRLSRADFVAAGVEHVIVTAGRHDADLPRVAADLARLCAWHIDFFGDPAPMARYLFLLRLTATGYGGLEHRASSALVCHRDHLPRHGQAGMSREYRRFLGLASHEYFHAWNGKRIRPLALVAPDLDREVCTRQLWLVEGVTSYYDDLALLRCGLISPSEYLDVLGRLLTSVYRTAGRRRQTLEEASFDAWIKHYRPDENSPNAHISYYTKGAMVALALDLEIRLRSEGRLSLDDVMRVLWRNFGRDGSPGLPEGAFEELVTEVTGLDLSEFFQASLRGSLDPPVGILLAQFGVRLTLRAARNSNDAGGGISADGGTSSPPSWLGLRVRNEQGRLRVAHVIDGGPAQDAGILAEDELVALQGVRIDPAHHDAAIERLDVGHPVDVHLFRRDELLCLQLTPAAAPRDTCSLAFDDEAAAGVVARRQRWLGGDR